MFAFVHCWWEYKLVKSLWKMSFLQKVKSRTTIWSSYPTSGYISKENVIIISKKYLYLWVHYSNFCINQDTETTKVSIYRWVDKQNMISHTTHTPCTCTHKHTYTGLLFSHEKEGDLSICSNMDEPWDHHVK